MFRLPRNLSHCSFRFYSELVHRALATYIVTSAIIASIVTSITIRIARRSRKESRYFTMKPTIRRLGSLKLLGSAFATFVSDVLRIIINTAITGNEVPIKMIRLVLIDRARHISFTFYSFEFHRNVFDADGFDTDIVIAIVIAIVITIAVVVFVDAGIIIVVVVVIFLLNIAVVTVVAFHVAIAYFVAEVARATFALAYTSPFIGGLGRDRFAADAAGIASIIIGPVNAGLDGQLGHAPAEEIGTLAVVFFRPEGHPSRFLDAFPEIIFLDDLLSRPDEPVDVDHDGRRHEEHEYDGAIIQRVP